MATNGVYFGAEIVRDLTPAPGSRMEETERGREDGVGEGREREPSSLAPILPLSLTYTLLCPSLSICLSASFLLWLSVSIPYHPPQPQYLSLLCWARLQAPPLLGPRQPPNWEWKQGVLGKLGPGFPGAWEWVGAGGGRVPGCGL